MERKEREIGDRHRRELQRRPSDFGADVAAVRLLPARNRKDGWWPPGAGERPERDPPQRCQQGSTLPSP